MSSHYTPFPGKAFASLQPSDLSTLREVSEGWYVEYKRAVPNAKSIAKSVSAFANTYGGWLFYGVQENDKSDNAAAACPGLPRSEVDAALQTIRHACASLLNPTPHFDTAVIWGPNLDMQLPEDCAVLCIKIPQSPNAPHIHASGAIYRRVADGSEPKAESDRHQLELLFNRREKINADYKRWIDRRPERSEGEDGSPYLRVLLEADLYGAQGRKWDLSVNDVREALNDNSSGPAIPLESVYPSAHGVVARQTSSLHRHDAFGLTWVVGTGLRCEIWLPINVHTRSNPNFFGTDLEKYFHTDTLVADLQAAKSEDTRVLDLNQLFMVLAAASSMYLNLLAKAQVSTDTVFAKVILDGIWRTIPFVDSAIMLDRARKSGMPLSLTDHAMIPSGTDAESFAEVSLLAEPG